MFESKEKVLTVADTTSNPAPLGLLGFGMTTVLLNMHNAGMFELNSMILAMGIFYGGAAQVIAGIMEWKKGNTFGTTAFTSYGFFWMTLVALFFMPKLGLAEASSATAMAAYLAMWGVFTGGLFIASLKHNRATQVIFGTLTLLFFLLALGDISGNHSIKMIAGVEGLFCGFSAIYAGLAQVINGEFKKTILPLG